MERAFFISVKLLCGILADELVACKRLTDLDEAMGFDVLRTAPTLRNVLLGSGWVLRSSLFHAGLFPLEEGRTWVWEEHIHIVPSVCWDVLLV